MNWIFKESELSESSKEQSVATVTFIQRMNFAGKVGEQVLTLLNVQGNWIFSAQYNIIDIQTINNGGQNREIKIYLSLIQRFEEEKNLDDYVYSLSKITDFKNPIKHFSRKYNRLEDAEFNAIVNNDIYEKRTILGTILNALHGDHQEAFIMYLANWAPELLTKGIDINRALNLLAKYLNSAIIIPSRYLKASAEIFVSLNLGYDFKEVGLALAQYKIELQNAQVFGPQLNIIYEYLESLALVLNEDRNTQIFDFGSSFEFERLFKNSPLPITLN